jgi:hypothetical protein
VRRFAKRTIGTGSAVAVVAAAITIAGCSGEATSAAQQGADGANVGNRPQVQVEIKEGDKRVDVSVDGQAFTAYIWPDTLKKPVLYPIHSADGVTVTRGFPPLDNERQDHPHHVGLWFNYGDVNGFDFWNNSDAIRPDRAPRMGSIVHKGITSSRSGAGEGRLEVEADWVAADGKTLLNEKTTFVFRAEPGVRKIDRIAVLTAAEGAGDISMKDNKEGMLGLRVIRALEDPEEKSGEFRDASGEVTRMRDMDTTGVTGQYRTSEGKLGKEAWGTRGKWTMLTGTADGKPLTVAILDHPKNPGYPTYWHARGYGLFAANTLGQAELSGGKDTLDFSIPAGQSATFQYRIVVFDATPTDEQVEAAYADWTAGT